MPVCVLILGGTGVDNREPSTGLAARELQLHLLEDEPPGCPLIFRSHLPLRHRTLTLFRLGPEIPTEQDHLITSILQS